MDRASRLVQIAAGGLWLIRVLNVVPLAGHGEQMHGAGMVVTRQHHTWLEDHPQYPDTDAGIEEQRLYIDPREIGGHGIFVDGQLIGIETQQIFVGINGNGHNHYCSPIGRKDSSQL
ncbi:hypothetical protein D3C87_1449830 [compost metagenome]